MKKFLTLMFMVGFSLSTFISFAQNPVFTLVPRDSCASVGDTIRVDCIVTDFTNVLSFQWSQGFDDGSLTFIDIIDQFSSEAITHGTTEPITMSWNSATAVTAPTGTLFYTLLFELNATAGLNSNVTFSNSPTFIEVVGEDSNGFLAEFTPNCTFNNGKAGITCGGGSGGPDCSQFTNAGHIIEDDSVATGDGICLPVYACGLNDLTSMQYTVAWDPAILQFDSTTAYNMEQLNGGAFGLTQVSNGFLTFSWFDSTGVGIDVPDLTPIYEICFTGIGAGGESTTVDFTNDLTSIELNDPMGGTIPFDSDPGTINISGNTGSALTVSVGGGTALEGDTICIDITTQNFENMEGLQHSLGWDPSLLSYIRTENAISGYSFNDAAMFTSTGRLICQWDNSATGSPVTLSDGSVLFSVCFEVVGSAGDCAEVAVTDDPAAIEAIQNDGMSSQSIPLVTQTGTVKVTAPGALTFSMGDFTGEPGDTICVPVEVSGFNQTSLQLGVKWDTAVVEFVEVANLNLPPTFNSSLNRPGALRVLWSDNLGNAASLADGASIFDVCLRLKGPDGSSTNLRFEGDTPAQDPAGFGFDMEFGDENGNPEAAVFVDGSITIEVTTIQPLVVSDTTATDVPCTGEASGAIDITISGGQPGYTYNWSTGATSEDVSGLSAGSYTVTVTDAMSTSIVETYTLTEPAAALAVSTSLMMIDCNGSTNGSIDVTVTGGTAPYSYDWSDNTLDGTEDPNGLSAGFYDLTVSDANGCSETTTAILTEPSLLRFDAPLTTFSNVDCNGDSNGSINLTVQGGTTPYAYDWSDNALDGTEDPNGLAAGTYNVTVTDGNGCVIDTSLVISEPTAIAIAGSQVNILCNGEATGSIDVSVSGGDNTYTYDWSDNTLDGTEDPTGLTAGNYGLTITDGAGCTAIESFTITQPSAIFVSASVSNEMTGNDGAIDLTVTGGTTPFSFSWSNGATTEDLSSLSSGTYTVTITDNNSCSTVETYNVNPASVPDPNATAPMVTDVDCNGNTTGAIDITITGGIPPYTFTWNSGATTEDISGIAAGTYMVTVTDANGQTAASNPIVVDEPAAISVSETISNVTCANQDDGSIDVAVTGGTTPYTFAWNNGSTQEDQSGLDGGIYTLTITDANGCTMVSGPFNVSEPLPISLTFFKNDISCPGENDGSIDITVNNGTPPYSYSWSRNGSPFAVSEDLNNIPGGNYQPTITDANGCVFVGGTIPINDQLAFNGNGIVTDTDCPGANNGSITYNFSGGTAPYSFAWSNNQFTQNISNLGPGNYSVTVSDANGCTFTDGPFGVAEGNVNFTSSGNVTDTDCAGSNTGAINFTVSGGTAPYDFDWNDNALDGTEDPSGIAAGTYNVTVTDANGCSFTDGPFTVANGTTAFNESVFINGTACDGANTGSIVFSISGGNTPYNYLWSNGATTANINNLGGGDYFVTVTDASNCSFVGGPYTVDTPAGISLNESITAATSSNDNGSITITPMGGQSPYTYSWTGPNSFTASTQNISGLAMGVYTVVVVDANGCDFTANYTVGGIFSLPNSLATVMDVSCNGGNDGAISIGVFGGATPYTYLWSNGEQVDNLQNLPDGTYMVTVTDANGMTVVGSYDVTQPDPLVFESVNINNESGQGCNGLINVEINGGTEPLQYIWSNGSTSEDLANVCKGSYSLTVIDANDCELISTMYTVLPPPINFDEIDVTNAGCNGDSTGTVSIITFGGCGPYKFELSNGMLDNSLNGSATFNGLPAGSYAVTVEDEFGQVSIEVFNVMQPAPIGISTIDITNNTDPTCNNPNGSINIEANGGVTPYSYQWSNGSTSEDVDDLCHNLSPFSVTITDANGCDFIFTGIDVNLGPSLVSSETFVEDIVCKNDADGSINITLQGGAPPFTYIWSDGATTQDRQNLGPGVYQVTITDSNGEDIVETFEIEEPNEVLDLSFTSVNATEGNTDGSINITVQGGWFNYTYQWTGPGGFTFNGADPTNLGPGTYTVVVTDAQGCQLTEQIVIQEITITADFVITRPSCNGEMDGFIIIEDVATPTPGASFTYVWNDGTTGPILTALGPGTYTVVITNTANGFSKSFPITVTEPDILSVSFDYDATVDILTANPEGGTSPYSYLWLTDNADTTQTLLNARPGLYILQLMDANGCTLQESVVAEEDPDLECVDIRTIITPNNDGLNDEFIIRCAFEFDNRLTVYNRWGQIVFEAENYDSSWLGTNQRGEALPEGGYFWILEYTKDGEPQQLKGNLTILR